MLKSLVSNQLDLLEQSVRIIWSIQINSQILSSSFALSKDIWRLWESDQWSFLECGCGFFANPISGSERIRVEMIHLFGPFSICHDPLWCGLVLKFAPRVSSICKGIIDLEIFFLGIIVITSLTFPLDPIALTEVIPNFLALRLLISLVASLEVMIVTLIIDDF